MTRIEMPTRDFGPRKRHVCIVLVDASHSAPERWEEILLDALPSPQRLHARGRWKAVDDAILKGGTLICCFESHSHSGRTAREEASHGISRSRWGVSRLARPPKLTRDTKSGRNTTGAVSYESMATHNSQLLNKAGYVKHSRKRGATVTMKSRRVFICDFELLERDGHIVALPVGLDGATQGLDQKDTIRMCADWLKETALDYLLRGKAWPDLPLGTSPTMGGRMITIAVDADVRDVPSMTAAEAAELLGISTARVAQLCNADLLHSWKVGHTRMVSIESVRLRLADKAKPGRPRKETSPA